MKYNNRYLIAANNTLNDALQEEEHKLQIKFYQYRNSERSLAKLMIDLIKNARAERKALQAYNRTVTRLSK